MVNTTTRKIVMKEVKITGKNIIKYKEKRKEYYK